MSLISKHPQRLAKILKGENMGIMEIATVIISLITTFGPKAIDIWNDWHEEVGDNPTAEQWAALKKKIEDHNPDAY